MCLYFNFLFGQTNKKISLNFKPIFNNNSLIFNDSTYFLDSAKTVKFEILKFYISKIQLFQNEKLVWQEQKSFHLIDAQNNQSLQLNLPSSVNFTCVKFNLGIDSLTNVSGALGGDLDPTKGMYWTWQSGYINFKLEGVSNQCKNPKKEFQFHLGGYSNSFNAIQSISLNTNYKKEIEIDLDVKQFLNLIDLSKQNHIMSPGNASVVLSQMVKKCFTVK